MSTEPTSAARIVYYVPILVLLRSHFGPICVPFVTRLGSALVLVPQRSLLTASTAAGSKNSTGLCQARLVIGRKRNDLHIPPFNVSFNNPHFYVPDVPDAPDVPVTFALISVASQLLANLM